jgi:hypothetical protein
VGGAASAPLLALSPHGAECHPCAESPESEIPSGYRYLATTAPQYDPSSGSGYQQAPAIDHTAAPSYVGIATPRAPEARRGAHYFGPHTAQELRASVGVRIPYNY